MSDPKRPDRRRMSAENQLQPPQTGEETIRPTDSTPVISSQFADLPATFGRYRVERLLGRGAMGAVYLALDTQFGRSVALKIPKVTVSGSKSLLSRIETEARAAALLDHPSTRSIVD